MNEHDEKEMRNFLEEEGDDLEMSVVDVTRKINDYIIQHDLQNPEKKSEIFPDDNLKTILGDWNEDIDGRLNFFKLQKHIKHNFLK